MTNQTATFHNFTDQPFTGYWNGKSKTFKPGEKQAMPTWLAEHFAKHLTNQELHKAGMDNYTSPKKPTEVPQFMDLFKRACIYNENEAGGNEIDDLIEVATAEAQSAEDEAMAGPSMNISVKPTAMPDPYDAHAQDVKPSGPSTVIGTPDDGEATDEDSFEGLKDDDSASVESK